MELGVMAAVVTGDGVEVNDEELLFEDAPSHEDWLAGVVDESRLREDVDALVGQEFMMSDVVRGSKSVGQLSMR